MSIIEKAFDKLTGSSNEADPGGDEFDEDFSGNEFSGDSELEQSLSEIQATMDTEDKDTSVHDEIEKSAKESPQLTAPERTSKVEELDMDHLEDLGFITPRTAGSMLAEQYRLIKRPLLTKAEAGHEAGHKNSNLIMVTSAVPAEGKTFTSINLAISMAMELDKTVLLVDADVAKADVTRTLNIKSVQGMTDVLMDKSIDLYDVMLKTNIPKLSILPSGQGLTNVTELLASDDMQIMVKEMAERYPDRIIIFDSPPLLATSGASVLTRMMGQVVMVIRAEKTTQNLVTEAMRQLHGCESVGIVLNRSRQYISRKYGYGYGYGYGHRVDD